VCTREGGITKEVQGKNQTARKWAQEEETTKSRGETPLVHGQNTSNSGLKHTHVGKGEKPRGAIGVTIGFITTSEGVDNTKHLRNTG